MTVASAAGHGSWHTVKRWVVPAGFNELRPDFIPLHIGTRYAIRITPAKLSQGVKCDIISEHSSSNGLRGEKHYSYPLLGLAFIRLAQPPRIADY
jgi:hypothetical protein